MNKCELCGDDFDRLNTSQYCRKCATKQYKLNIDSDKGYTVDNVVPCCPECNRMKGTQSVDSFIMRCKAIADSF